MSLDRCKMETSASQFVLWREYLKWEVNNAFHREDHLASIIASEIRRSYVKEPMKVKPSHFLPMFGFKKEIQETKLDAQTRANIAKRFFFGLTGLIGNIKKGKS